MTSYAYIYVIINPTYFVKKERGTVIITYNKLF